MIIGSGAEAQIQKIGEHVRKVRLAKTFRHPDLDFSLRRKRTRREAKVLATLAQHDIPAPTLISSNDKDMEIEMSFIDGPQVRDYLNEQNATEIATQIGSIIKRMHQAEIIHGDITTSNMIFSNNQINIIDFGLSFFSQQIEDQATDLHLLKQAVHAKHPNLDLWNTIWATYHPTEELSKRFQEVELRGRYKGKGQ